LLSAVIYVTTR